jgi:hypothetical protein
MIRFKITTDTDIKLDVAACARTGYIAIHDTNSQRNSTAMCTNWSGPDAANVLGPAIVASIATLAAGLHDDDSSSMADAALETIRRGLAALLLEPAGMTNYACAKRIALARNLNDCIIADLSVKAEVNQ